jgi:hypothetical protein
MGAAWPKIDAGSLFLKILFQKSFRRLGPFVAGALFKWETYHVFVYLFKSAQSNSEINSGQSNISRKTRDHEDHPQKQGARNKFHYPVIHGAGFCLVRI